MEYDMDYTVIIPVWRGAIKYLPKLIDSIPEKEGIEIIVVDNSKEPVKREEIDSSRDFVLLHSAHDRHAGGSRNDGIAAAKGKWLLFADADDYFTDRAFDIFDEYKNTEYEMIYFCARGEYSDTGEPSSRGESYSRLVKGYLNGSKNETDLRLLYSVPWAKMVKHSLVDKEKIRYDEVVASNDMYFSLLTGYYAKTIMAVDEEVYVVTVSKGSLTRRRDKAVTLSRYTVNLRYNEFVKKHNHGNYQKSVMVFIKWSFSYGFPFVCEVITLLFKYHQNPLIGWRNWMKTNKNMNQLNKREGKYIVKTK